MKRWTLADGRHIHYRQAGRGAPLVLLHGWSLSSAVFGEALNALRDSFTVLVPDLPGHGLSSPGKDYRLTALADDLNQWMAGLKLQQVRLLGWSLGGQIALRMAGSDPQRLSRLLLVATTPRFLAGPDWSHGLAATRLRLLQRDLKRRPAATLSSFFDSQFGPREIDAERRNQLHRTVSAAVFAAQPDALQGGLKILAETDLRSELAGVKLPVLVQQGGVDAIIPEGAGRFLAENLPQAHLFLQPELGHAPFLSRPEISVERWRRFFRP